MIHAVRLRPHNKKKGMSMRTYTSANSSTKYTAGEYGIPSTVRIVNDPSELRELREYPQFEILVFDTMDELDEFLTKEVQQASRQGRYMPKAAVMGSPVLKKVVEAVKSKAVASRIFDKGKQEGEGTVELTDEDSLLDDEIPPPQTSMQAMNAGRKPKLPPMPTPSKVKSETKEKPAKAKPAAKKKPKKTSAKKKKN